MPTLLVSGGKITGEVPCVISLKLSSMPECKPSEENRSDCLKIEHVETHNAHQADANFFTRIS